MAKINLLYVITKLELGGAQKQLLSLITHLDKTRYNIFLFTASQGLLMEEASVISGLTVKKSRFLERPINPFKDILALLEIKRFIKENNIQIVHTHSSKAGILGRWAAKLSGVKIIIHTVHGWPFHDYQAKFLSGFFIWLERRAAQFTDQLIIVSNHDRQIGLKSRIGSDIKYRLIRYGVEYDKFNALDKNFRKELGIKDNELVVGMIASFKPQKCPQDFIQLASSVSRDLPNTKFILVGDGVLRKKTEQLINKYNLQKKVILVGWRRDIPEILASLDIFVLTSLWEGLPISALEAMAASLPVITTNTGGVSEIVEEGKNGFLIYRKDTQSMSDKLISLLKDSNIRKQMGEKAKASLGADFSLANMLQNHENLYSDLSNQAATVHAFN
jgi:glycosyltransferase involved in cell wall biosynthesis